jgi:hypothetical protein
MANGREQKQQFNRISDEVNRLTDIVQENVETLVYAHESSFYLDLTGRRELREAFQDAQNRIIGIDRLSDERVEDERRSEEGLGEYGRRVDGQDAVETGTLRRNIEAASNSMIWNLGSMLDQIRRRNLAQRALNFRAPSESAVMNLLNRASSLNSWIRNLRDQFVQRHDALVIEGNRRGLHWQPILRERRESTEQVRREQRGRTDSVTGLPVISPSVTSAGHSAGHSRTGSRQSNESSLVMNFAAPGGSSEGSHRSYNGSQPAALTLASYGSQAQPPRGRGRGM